MYLALGYMDGGSLEEMLAAYRKVSTTEDLSSMGLPEAPSAHVLFQVVADALVHTTSLTCTP